MAVTSAIAGTVPLRPTPADPKGDKPLPPELPTTTLYFLEPLKRLARRCALPGVERISRHVYACGDVVVISRYASLAEIARIRARAPRRVVYLIDDNIVVGVLDPGLPADYRKRLKAFQETGHPAVLREATDIVVPNRLLADLYRSLAPEKPVHLVHPVWPERPVRPTRPDDGILRVAYLGSRSHARDIRLIAGRLARFLRDRKDVELYTTLDPGGVFSKDGVPVTRLPFLRWPAHRRFIGGFSADIGLNPLLDTPFNRCRSINKFVEYGRLGALCLYSGEIIQCDDRLGFPEEYALGRRPQEWVDRLAAYCADRDLLEADKANYVARLDGWGHEDATVAFWERFLRAGPRGTGNAAPVDRREVSAVVPLRPNGSD